MLIYEKMKDGVRRLFGTKANVPSENDTQLTYKKEDGTVVELTKNSQLKDDGHGGMKLNGERVIAWMGNESVIPKGETPAPSNVSFAETVKEVKAVEEVKLVEEDAQTEAPVEEAPVFPKKASKFKEQTEA